MSDKAKVSTLDGRRLRSERSKKAILSAVERLMIKGVLVPTAQTVADEAGMPIRSLFRHFPDMESLFHALDAQLKIQYERIYLEDIPRGSFSSRIAMAVDLRARGYEANRSIIRSTKAQLWRYETLQNNYARGQQRLRDDLDQRLPELRELNEDSREIVDAITSYEMWARLRDHQKLDVAKSSAIVEQMIVNLLKGQLPKYFEAE